MNVPGLCLQGFREGHDHHPQNQNEMAQKPYKIGSLGPKARTFESFEGSQGPPTVLWGLGKSGPFHAAPRGVIPKGSCLHIYIYI